MAVLTGFPRPDVNRVQFINLGGIGIEIKNILSSCFFSPSLIIHGYHRNSTLFLNKTEHDKAISLF